MKISGKKKLLIAGASTLFIIAVIFLAAYLRTLGRVQIEFDISQNKDIIYLSTFAEPPQFAIWLEDPVSSKKQTVFVTHRAGIGDWEGKAEVPSALPFWFKSFSIRDAGNSNRQEEQLIDAITGATPKEDHFIIRAEVPPETSWICYIEMNLAGDFNDSYPEFNEENLEYDEFSCGQPALVYRAEIKAEEGFSVSPELFRQSVLTDGEARLEQVSPGITTAREVFHSVNIKVIRPKARIIDKTKIRSEPE